jgi:hypothetical protein
MLGSTKIPKTAKNVGVTGKFSGLEQWAAEFCETGSDMSIYNELFMPVFWNRYSAMKAHPSKCCRKAKARKEVP